MHIIIERSLEKSYELLQQEWKHKTIKSKIYLLIMALSGISIAFAKNYAQQADGEYSYFSVILGTLFITYALTSLRFSYAYKSAYLKNWKYKLLKHIPYLTTIKLTEETALISNPEFTITYNWDYFKHYKTTAKSIFIYSTPKSLGIAIAVNEISEKERFDLFNLLESKGIRKV